MNDKQSSIEDYLLQFASLDQFLILNSNHFQPGLVYFIDSQGTAFALMDDDDDRVEQCVKFLESKNCPIFDDVLSLKKHTEQFSKE